MQRYFFQTPYLGSGLVLPLEQRGGGGGPVGALRFYPERSEAWVP